ncbi:MAG: hypothetical protein ACREQQ_00815, partial [Candidatus Binatia bacterium]
MPLTPESGAGRGGRSRARRALFGTIAAAALSLSACSYAVVRDGTIDAKAATTIERGLEEIRALRFLTRVPMEVKSPEELRVYIRQELDREYSPTEIRGLERIYRKLGLWPDSLDLGQELLKLYDAQIAGFYDPHQAKLFLVPSGVPSTGWTIALLQLFLRRDLVNEMLLAHELTHALQDQHFGALALAENLDDDDRALAIHAVLEGDATLAGFAYVFGGLAVESLPDLVQRLGTIPAELAAMLPDTPPLLRDSLVFQYSAGSAFVARAYSQGGWPGVDALLAYPPTSTEQILWPEKYFGRPDTPTEVRLGGLDGYENDPAWTEVETNTFGELTIRILAEGFFDSKRAERTAEGWDGDRFTAFTRGEELHLYWMSSWDSAEDASEFFAAESEMLAIKYPAAERKVEADRVVAGGEDPYWLERRGDKVLLVWGLPRKKA